MARQLMRGEPLYILFDDDGESVFDSQNRPRMYKSVEAFEKAFPRGMNGAHLEKYVPSQKWISVKDRLPDIHEYVLMHSHSCGTDIGFRMEDGVFGCDVGYYLEIGDVTHWMPLPEAPKEE